MLHNMGTMIDVAKGRGAAEATLVLTASPNFMLLQFALKTEFGYCIGLGREGLF